VADGAILPKTAYERMEMAILGFMDAEWPRLVQAEVERDKVA